MAIENRNTINPDTIKVGFWVEKADIMQTFKVVATGLDRELNNLWVQTHQLVGERNNLGQVWVGVSTNERPNSGRYISYADAYEHSERLIKALDNSENPQNFLLASLVQIRPNFSCVVDEKRITIWRPWKLYTGQIYLFKDYPILESPESSSMQDWFRVHKAIGDLPPNVVGK